VESESRRWPTSVQRSEDKGHLGRPPLTLRQTVKPNRRAVRRRLLVAVCAVATFLVLTAGAQAAKYTVGTTADGSGVCADPAGGKCSLRQLIEYENGLKAAPDPADTIVVPSGVYDLVNGALTITTNLSIVGAGAGQTSIAHLGESPDRVFAIQIPVGAGPPVVPTVTISGVSITSGEPPADGGNGGNVYNQGTLTLSDDELDEGGTSAGDGAGAFNDGGTMTVTHSLVLNNFANWSDSTGTGGIGGGSSTPAQTRRRGHPVSCESTTRRSPITVPRCLEAASLAKATPKTLRPSPIRRSPTTMAARAAPPAAACSPPTAARSRFRTRSSPTTPSRAARAIPTAGPRARLWG